MIIAQYLWSGSTWDERFECRKDFNTPQLVLIFGERNYLDSSAYFEEIKNMFPSADIVISSTSGEILGNEVYDSSITATVIEFEKTTVRIKEFDNKETADSLQTGENIAKSFAGDNLKGIFILSDGQLVNGSELLTGVNSITKGEVVVTGGLAGDADRFEKTLVGLNKIPQTGKVVAVGLYGDQLQISHGSMGGWDSFGPEREVTKSDKNVLYQLDNDYALDLYKQYLGERSNELPGSALLFPLLLINEDHPEGIVRTILAVDHEAKSMTFAGNLPEGSMVQLMKANFDKLIDGSAHAAQQVVKMNESKSSPPELAILISCVGRKLVLGQMTGEEVEEVSKTIGDSTYYTGFYSYGELSPIAGINGCKLHNQTMTITTFSEI